jgi:hypothetical protein
MFKNLSVDIVNLGAQWVRAWFNLKTLLKRKNNKKMSWHSDAPVTRRLQK